MAQEKDEPDHSVPLLVDGDSLCIEDVIDVARRKRKVQLSDAAREKMASSRAWVDGIIDQARLTVYGLTTGYGSLAEVSIPPQDVETLTRNLVMSHAAGVGQPLAEEAVRATMLIRANTLAKGYSGIRVIVLERLLAMLNQGLHPLMPEKGSLGASGDLAPLAHLALALSEGTEGGEAFYKGELLEAGEAMRQAGLERVVLRAKEGLALINGSTVSAALAVLACHDAEMLLKNAEIALAMSLEAMRGVSDAFHESVHDARGHEGQKRSAANVRSLTRGSELLDSTERVQDAYSLRCGPQVIGAVRDVLAFVRHIIGVEINAATDNPLIVLDLPESRENKSISGGNFHGEPLALAMDLLGIALAEIGGISERRTFRLLDKSLSSGLPAMLARDSGLNSGLMMAQYTAAALVSENKTLAHPDSVDSVPSSANQEDHVSMSMNAALHAREIAKNVQQIVGIEMLCAAQGLDFRHGGLEFSSSKWLAKGHGAGHKKLVEYDLDQGTTVAKAHAGLGTEAAYRSIRAQIDHLSTDRPLYPDLQRIAEMVRSGEIVEATEAALGAPLMGSPELTIQAS